MLIDVLRAPGLDAMAQVDLGTRSTAHSRCWRSARCPTRCARGAWRGSSAGPGAATRRRRARTCARRTRRAGVRLERHATRWSSARRWRTSSRLPWRCAASTPTSTARCSAGARRCCATREGNFSTLAVRALEACHRAGVEVVIKSGRRKAQVYEDARLIGQPAYIYEMGCGLVDGAEEVFLTGSFEPRAATTVYEQVERAGRAAPAARDLSRAGSSTTRPGTPTASSRTCSAATSTSAEVDELLAEHGLGPAPGRQRHHRAALRPSWTSDECTLYHLIPAAAGKASAVAAHMRRRGLGPRR